MANPLPVLEAVNRKLGLGFPGLLRVELEVLGATPFTALHPSTGRDNDRHFFWKANTIGWKDNPS
ncbi:hypothetical protein OAU93_00110 [bacterium]|nr:hypothetical protein [bacterium]